MHELLKQTFKISKAICMWDSVCPRTIFNILFTTVSQIIYNCYRMKYLQRSRLGGLWLWLNNGNKINETIMQVFQITNE